MARSPSRKTPAHSAEHRLLLDQLGQVAEGLARTFAPFCEVVLHDLQDPHHSVLAIHNNLSGRQPGEPATELGLARVMDPDYPQLIANYANQFADGRQAKSTSIGIKDSQGRYIAALCLNVDLSLFRGFQSALSQFAAVDGELVVDELLAARGGEQIRQQIDRFAARLSSTPRALRAEDRRLLLQELRGLGLLDVRRAMETIAAHLGVSRASVYAYAK